MESYMPIMFGEVASVLKRRSDVVEISFSDDFLEYATLARVIKYKRDHKSEITDTVGLIVVDAFHGRGKQLGHIALCC